MCTTSHDHVKRPTTWSSHFTARSCRSTEHQSTKHQANGTGHGVLSREIFDLVCTCNLASRKGYGEVVWFWYNVTENKWSHKEGFVGYGSQGVCFTKGVGQSARSGHDKLHTEALRYVAEGDALPRLQPPCQGLAIELAAELLHLATPGRLVRARDGHRWPRPDAAISLRGALGTRGISWSRSPNG